MQVIQYINGKIFDWLMKRQILKHLIIFQLITEEINNYSLVNSMNFSAQVRNSLNQQSIHTHQLKKTPSQINHGSGIFGSNFNIITQAIMQQQMRYNISYGNPASIKLAEKHQQATKYGYKPKPKGTSSREIRMNEKQMLCGCCNFSSNNEQIGILESVEPSADKQFKLSQDVALYFTFIKNMVFFIVLQTVIQSAFNVISSWSSGTYCDKVLTCQKQFWNKTSISNKYDHQDLIGIVNILNLAAIGVSIIYFGWGRRHFYKVSQDIDRESVSQADFTLFISNIPRIQYPDSVQNPHQVQSTSREQLKTFLQSFITQGIRNGFITRTGKSMNNSIQNSDIRNSSKMIKSVSLCYNLSELEILHDEKWSLIWQFQNNFILIDLCGFKIPDLLGFRNPLNYQGHVNSMNNIAQDQQQSSKTQNIKRRFETNLNKQVDYNLLNVDKRNQLNEIRSRVNYICGSQIAMGNELVKNKKIFFHNVNFSGNSFVSFQFQDFKQYIHKSYLENPAKFIFKGVQLKIQDACDPTDVKWYNMKIPSSVRTNRIIFSYIVLAMLLIISFLILFSVELLKRNYAQTEHGGILNFAKSQGLSLITSLIILGANSLFDFVSWFLTNLEGHQTKTNQMFSHMVKSFLSRLFNTIFMYFIISVILTRDYDEQKFMSSTGLVTQIYNLIVVSGLINLIHVFINKQDIWARIKRWYIYKYRQESDHVFTRFQITLNQEFELPEFNLVYKYNDYLITVYTALFYSYLVPIGIPTLIVIFGAQYWIDKFTLFKRSSLKNNFSYNLSIYVRKIFQTSIFIFALGNLIFSFYLQDYKVSIINIIGLIVAVLFGVCVWIAPAGVERKLFGQYEAIDPLSYTECIDQYRFKATYWNQNPATFCVDENVQMSKSSWSPNKRLNKNRMSIEHNF